MTYFSYTEREMPQAGVQEGELAIYTGTVNPRQPNCLHSGSHSNAYVFLWRDGQPQDLAAQFWRDSAGMDVLEVQAGEETYVFLRDRPSGYIRQTAGPAKPIAVANFGVIPLRVDTFLGKFTVYAGTMLRLDENAPQREKKQVLLTLSSRYKHPLERAELWEEGTWRRLNIRNEPDAYNGEHGQTVLDGCAVVQHLIVNVDHSILMMDSPEPDPDYEIFVAAECGDRVTLRFNRTDYRDGRVAQRVRSPQCYNWDEPAVYSLQGLRESQTQGMAEQCAVRLPGLPDERKEDASPEGKRRPLTVPLASDKLRAFLEARDEPCAAPEEARTEGHGDDKGPQEPFSIVQTAQEEAAPEPPGDFPA